MRKGAEMLLYVAITLFNVRWFAHTEHWWWQIVAILFIAYWVDRFSNAWGLFWDGPDE